jgi:RNA polymerase sigma-70 factor (ECF subfamily)
MNLRNVAAPGMKNSQKLQQFRPQAVLPQWRSMTDERALAAKILAGDGGAFRTLVERYQRLVSHVVFRMILNDTDREDVCQEIFLKVYENLPTFRFDSKISTWIAKIAYNTSVSHLEKTKAHLYDSICPDNQPFQELSDNSILPDEYAETQDLSLRLAREIDRLPVLYGTILSLYHLEGMSYNEIRQIMQLPEGTVKSYLFRARKLLKKRLLASYQREEL